MPKHYSKDPLECCLIRDELADIKDDELEEYARFLEAQLYIQPQKDKIEELRSENLNILVEEKVPHVEFKPFLPLIMYEFLGPNSTYLVIINDNHSKIKIESCFTNEDCIEKP